MSLLFIVEALYKGLKAIMYFASYWPIINIMISSCGIVFICNQIRALMEAPAWCLYAVLYNLNFETFNPVSRLPSQFVECFSNTESVLILVCMLSMSSNVFLSIRAKWKKSPPRSENADWQGIWRGLGRISEVWGPAMSWDFTLELLILVCMLSMSSNVFLSIRAKWKKSPPRSENADWQGIWRGLGRISEVWGPAMSWDFTLEHLWDPEKLSQHLSQGQCGLDRSKEARLIWGLGQGIWRGLGKILEVWGPAMSWDFTLEHLWDPEKLSQYLSQAWCGLDRSKEVQLIWGLACAYRALYNTILERESFRAEVQAKGGNLQVKSDQSQETPVTVSAIKGGTAYLGLGLCLPRSV